MKKVLWTLMTLVLISAFVLSGCARTPTPTAEPEEPKVEEPKEEPTEEPVVVEEVTISVWHGYIETEEQVFSKVVNDFMTANPNITIDVLVVPFDELQNKFQTEVAAGAGPTLVTGPQDRMAGYASAGLLAEIDDRASFIADLVPAAVDGGRIDGVLVGIPINNKVLALFYNKSMVDAPPEDFDGLLAMAAEHGMSLTADWFHNYMWVPAFGAALFDENYKCILDTSGAAKAFEYYKSVCDSEGVVCNGNDGDMDTLFRQGQVAFRVQGPWMSGDAIKDLGAENVGIAKIPTISGQGEPRPWNQSEMIQISVNATDEQKSAAMLFIEYLTSNDVQKMYLDEANWIPANASVDTSSNPVVGGFLSQVPYSDPFPVVAELGATWAPMGDAVTKILEGVSTPEEAIAEATGLINTTNNK